MQNSIMCEKAIIDKRQMILTTDAELTSLFNSFWEPLESGFEPLIFIPSK